jgi:response regulator of citrate/malate metabolism
MAEWRTVIVEDVAAVAEVHRRLVARTRGFVVVGTAATLREAVELVRTRRPHLVLLDLGLPDGDGLRLLRRLRTGGAGVEVIAVTASRGSEVVRACVHLGVLDYLVKPFPPERLRQALGRLAHRTLAMDGAELSQAEVDRARAGGRAPVRELPRQLAPDTLTGVRQALRDAAAPRSAAEIAKAAGIGRVTARRYLEYLVTEGEAAITPLGAGRGRRAKGYHPPK